MLYKYSQVAFPYAELVAENARRTACDPEYELFDALEDAFRDQRYFDVSIEYAKADADDILCRIVVINRGRDAADIHVLPHAWFRNTWSWTHGATRPAFYAAAPGAARTNHPVLGERWWYVRAIDGTIPPLLFTENETNTLRLFGHPNARPCVKAGINDAVVYGRREGIEEYSGSKAAAHLRRTVAAGASFAAQVRLSPRALAQPFDRFDYTVENRIREADEFYGVVQLHEMTADERLV